MLRSMSGSSYAEVLAERDGEAYTYMVESEFGVDIRKRLFYELATRNWALIGLESLGMSFEDIFISVVDQSEKAPAKTTAASARPRRQRGKEKDALEQELGASLLEDAKKQRAEAALQDVEDED